MSSIVSVEHLIKRYDDLNAVDDVSFTIEQAGCYGLLGPNGAGKTTTIEMMEGIIKPSSGNIRYYGQSQPEQIAQKIGIQFQHTALQDFLTVKETLKLFASFYQNAVAIDELIQSCDLTHFVDKDNRLLSGGQRQRLLLALALINDPDIVFLDEPTTGLDPQSRRNFWQLIKQIKQRGKTIILTTHYMDEAEFLCDQVMVMDSGKIIEQGAPQALLQQYFPEVFVYLPKAQVPEHLIADQQWQVVNQQVEINTLHIEQTMQLLIEHQVPLVGLQVKSATLDDLFLHLTGHSLRD